MDVPKANRLKNQMQKPTDDQCVASRFSFVHYHPDRCHQRLYSGNGYGSQGIGLATAEVPRGDWCYRTGPTAR